MKEEPIFINERYKDPFDPQVTISKHHWRHPYWCFSISGLLQDLQYHDTRVNKRFLTVQYTWGVYCLWSVPWTLCSLPLTPLQCFICTQWPSWTLSTDVWMFTTVDRRSNSPSSSKVRNPAFPQRPLIDQWEIRASLGHDIWSLFLILNLITQISDTKFLLVWVCLRHKKSKDFENLIKISTIPPRNKSLVWLLIHQK